MSGRSRATSPPSTPTPPNTQSETSSGRYLPRKGARAGHGAAAAGPQGRGPHGGWEQLGGVEVADCKGGSDQGLGSEGQHSEDDRAGREEGHHYVADAGHQLSEDEERSPAQNVYDEGDHQVGGDLYEDDQDEAQIDVVSSKFRNYFFKSNPTTGWSEAGSGSLLINVTLDGAHIGLIKR